MTLNWRDNNNLPKPLLGSRETKPVFGGQDRSNESSRNARPDRPYLLGLDKVSGDSSPVHVAALEAEARQSQKQAQLAPKPREEITASHVGEQACDGQKHEFGSQGGRDEETAVVAGLQETRPRPLETGSFRQGFKTRMT